MVVSVKAKTHVWGIGNSILGDDGVGIYVARMLKRLSPRDFEIVICESVPENFAPLLKRKKPKHLVIVDAAQMNLPPGSIRRIPLDESTGSSEMTHGIPILPLLNYYGLSCLVTTIGIQPKILDFSTELSVPLRKAAKKVAKIILRSKYDEIPFLTS